MNLSRKLVRSIGAAVALVVAIPAVAAAAHPFVDVPGGAFYADAVDWAFNNNITTGTTPTTFEPDATTTRGQVVTFQKRMYDLLVEQEINGFGYAQSSVGVFDDSATVEALPNATTTVTIPDGHTGRIEIRFSAESSCSGGAAFLGGPWCEVHVLVNGTDSFGNNVAFDSTDGSEGVISWESHAVTYVTGELPAGDHTVSISYQSKGSTPPDFALADWTLTAEVQLTS